MTVATGLAPAFPVQELNSDGSPATLSLGINVRTYAAVAALQGLLANPKLAPEILKRGGARGGWVEASAVAWADALIAQLEKQS